MSSKSEHDEAKLRHLCGYISLLRDELRMQNWDVILHRTIAGDDDIYAHTWQNDNHFTLNIELGSSFFDESPERQTNTLLHELIHAQHRDVTLVWEGCTLHNDDVARSAARSWDGDFRMHMERFVSWITNQLAPTVSTYSASRKYKPNRVWLYGEQPA